MAQSVRPGAAADFVADTGAGDSVTGSGGKLLARLGRWLALTAGVAALGLSYFFPWWSFTLYAPQYPGGLKLVVGLSQVTGDVREINTLNHYIGMKSLALAAPLERAFASYALAALVLAVLGAATLLRGRWRRVAAALAAFLPLGFIVDSWLWLWHFGHALDPRAPIDLPPFTPQLFGNGQIGQFMTFAQPGPGFLLAFVAPLLVFAAVWMAEGPSDGAGSCVRPAKEA